jgi:hypothetical protein
VSDFHFVVRNGLTGAVLAAFALIGLWMRGGDGLNLIPWSAMTSGTSGILGVVISAAIVAVLPVVGIVIQAMYISGFLLTTKLAPKLAAKLAAGSPDFSDEARQVVWSRFERVAKKLFPGGVEERDGGSPGLFTIRADPAFVWLYYNDVQAHVVDWARRRRSYHYLGVTWAIACLLGLAIGLFAPDVAAWPHAVHVAIASVLSAIWVVSAWFLAAVMWRDADEMELAWAYGRLYPELKQRVAAEPGLRQPKEERPPTTA